MKPTEEIRKEMASSEMQEMVKLLENLGGTSRVLAKTYLSALEDKEQMEKEKMLTA